MNEGYTLEETIFALIARALPGTMGAAPLRTVTAELSLRRDLGLDSLGLATLLFNVGEEIGVDPNDLIEMLADEPITTVGDVVALARKITRGAAEEPPR